MDKNFIKIPAQFTGYIHKVDKSVSLKFISALEFSPDQVKQLAEHFQETGWLLFGSESQKYEEVPKEDVSESRKTQSQRLRAVLFVLWEKKRNNKEDVSDNFEEFYRQRTERIIEQYKEILSKYD